MNLNKNQLINEAFNKYNLSSNQKLAVEETINGYIKLINVSTDSPPTQEVIKIFVDLIKSNLVNTLNVLEINLESAR